MEAAGTLRRQHRPCRGLRSFQMTRWQRPNEQQLLLHLLHLLLTFGQLAPARDWIEASTADFVEASSVHCP